MKYQAIITAGGNSTRFGKKNKLLEKINGKEVIRYSIDTFLNTSEIEKITICANPSIIDLLKKYYCNENRVIIIEGGKTRQESVYKGLESIKNCDYVLIHDGARPVISTELIKNILKENRKALTVATKTTDTIKVVNDNKKIIKTLDRNLLYNTQTPQAFDFELIKKVHEKYKGENFSDDAGMVEAYGEDVFVFGNDYKNIKITTSNDIDIAKIYLS